MEPGQLPSAPITSLTNSQAKWLRELRERRGREAVGAFLVEGPRAIAQALSAGHHPIRVAVGAERTTHSEAVRRTLTELRDRAPIYSMDDLVLRSISDTIHSQGILAAFPLFNWHPALLPNTPRLLLILDRISDPGNVGTLLRSAAAAGCDAVLLSEGSVDPYNPKVVRASAGGIFGVNFAVLSWSEIRSAVAQIPRVYAADALAESVYYEADLGEPCAILVGNEAVGLGEEALALSSASVRIPISGGVESLNAGVAGSLLLFEALRQRAQRSGGVTDVPR